MNVRLGEGGGRHDGWMSAVNLTQKQKMRSPFVLLVIICENGTNEENEGRAWRWVRGVSTCNSVNFGMVVDGSTNMPRYSKML